MKVKNSILTIAFVFLIIICFIFSQITIFIGNSKTTLLPLLGFFLVAFTLFLFFYMSEKKKLSNEIELKVPSEKVIKSIFFIALLLFFFFPPTKEIKMLDLWEHINILNIILSLISLLILSYLPGACLYNIISSKISLFKEDLLSRKIVNITIYPLISFGFLGTITLVLDQFNLGFHLIRLFILIIIALLFTIDFVLTYLREKEISFKSHITTLKLKHTELIIFFLAFSISIITIGIQCNLKYTVSGDPWDSIKFAKFIGDLDLNPLIWAYPNFWGYISFGLSSLSCLPLINMNTLLAPFSYLFITGSYIFFRVILRNFKREYAILSTSLLSIFSGFFSIEFSSLIFIGEYFFIYKSYGYILFSISFAFFIHFINSKNKDHKNRISKRTIFNLLFIAVLIVWGFITYIYPLIFFIILAFIYIYCGNKNRSKDFKFLYWLLILIFFIIFLYDLIMNFYLSDIIFKRFLTFFYFLEGIFNYIPPILLIYGGYILIITIIFCFSTYFSTKKVKEKNRDKIYTYFYIILISFFIIFLIIELVFLFNDIFLSKIDSSNYSVLLHYLEYFYENIGYIGIIGFLLSYICLKKDKSLFIKLITIILITLFIAFIYFDLKFIFEFPIKPIDLPANYNKMYYWFRRTYYYSIPSLCIFASIGIIEIHKKIRAWEIFEKFKTIKILSKNIFLLSLIIFSFSGVIKTALDHGNAKFRYSDAQINTLAWCSENLPVEANILVYDNFFMWAGMDSVGFFNPSNFQWIYYGNDIDYLKSHDIKFLILNLQLRYFFPDQILYVNNTLIPQFYNKTLYNSGDLSVYYAPYFD